MCTNYVPTRTSLLNERFGLSVPGVAFRDEAYPGYLAPIIRRQLDEPSEQTCEAAIFGLIPSWSKDGKNYRFCYNARSETVDKKPSFRNAIRRNQFCVVPAEAFFEPCYETGRPVRWRIERLDGEPLMLAGIWDAWRRPQSDTAKRPGPKDCDLLDSDWVLSFSLLTINADSHDLMKRFHPAKDEKRSVVMLDANQWREWLQTENRHIGDFLHAAKAAELTTREAPKKPAKTRAKPPPKPTRKLF